MGTYLFDTEIGELEMTPHQKGAIDDLTDAKDDLLEGRLDRAKERVDCAIGHWPVVEPEPDPPPTFAVGDIVRHDDQVSNIGFSGLAQVTGVDGYGTVTYEPIEDTGEAVFPCSFPSSELTKITLPLERGEDTTKYGEEEEALDYVGCHCDFCKAKYVPTKEERC